MMMMMMMMDRVDDDDDDDAYFTPFAPIARGQQVSEQLALDEGQPLLQWEWIQDIQPEL